MHEVDMTKCLLLALQQWREQQASPQAMVDTIHLDVGRFTCVEPDQLQFTFQAAIAGTWLDGAQLQIEEIVSGRELRIRSIDYRTSLQSAVESQNLSLQRV